MAKSRQVRGDNDVCTIVAGEAITAKRLVTSLGKHTADKAAVGVAEFDTDSGDAISVLCGPIEEAESGAAITAGDGLKMDSSGRVITWATSGHGVGTALDAATAAGEFIRIALNAVGNAA